jgi:hypothetical protein
LRHPAEAGLVVRDLVELAADSAARPPKTASASVDEEFSATVPGPRSAAVHRLPRVRPPG